MTHLKRKQMSTRKRELALTQTYRLSQLEKAKDERERKKRKKVQNHVLEIGNARVTEMQLSALPFWTAIT